MGANLYYRPIKKAYSLNHGGRSTVIEAITEAFGEFPVRLGDDELHTLKAMQAAAQNEPAWEALQEAIKKHGEIEVFAEY